jgi:CxxC motif-containing protein (DUF1111 family)
MKHHRLLLAATASAAIAACSSSREEQPPPATDPPPAGLDASVVRGDPIDQPLAGASAEVLARFAEGDRLFDLPFTEGDGLGPVYIRQACSSCHTQATRGPGLVQKMVVVASDGLTPSDDQSKLLYGHTVRPYFAGGGTKPILPPPGDSAIKVSTRIGPPVLGRGYMEAIEDAEIERVAAEQATRPDGIHGRIHRVTFNSEKNSDTKFPAYIKGQSGIIGRFGLKARIASLDDFAADALQGDMGITSPMRPSELPNPDGLTDDKRIGTDTSLGIVNALADYTRLLELPARTGLSDRGRALFAETKCAVCHVPSLHTRSDYPIALLAGIDAPVFTDMLLHDMGDALADSLPEGNASGREWRTPALVGLRFFKTYLHDGRAKSIEEAVLLHEGNGSQAATSIALFRGLSEGDRGELLRFVSAL